MSNITETRSPARVCFETAGARDWMGVLARLPVAVGRATSEAHALALVASCVVPSVACAIAIDRVRDGELAREHSFAVKGVTPIEIDPASAASALTERRSALARGALSVAVPGTPTRVITLRAPSPYVASDLAFAEITGRWLALAFSRFATEDALSPGDTLIATAVHDLMNPLTVISVNARALRDGAPGQREARIALIERAADRMCDIARDCLSEVRRSTERVSLTLEWVYVGELLQEAIEAVRDAASGKALRIEVESCDGLVLCDRMRITRVLVNLLDNAVRHTDRGGTITIAAARGPTHTKISVADTGCGIGPEVLGRLFERYFRATAGTGIGLATARAFTAAHDSDLKVDSVVGQGTKFWFELHSAE